MTEQLATLGALVVLTAAIGVWWSARQGAVRAPARGAAAEGGIDWSEAGVTLGSRTTFVQFSAEVCAPCRATARVLGELASAYPGVTHRELDVDDNLGLVRQLSVLRTPTVLVLDPSGREVARLSGAVSRTRAREALEAGERGAPPPHGAPEPGVANPSEMNNERRA